MAKSKTKKSARRGSQAPAQQGPARAGVAAQTAAQIVAAQVSGKKPATVVYVHGIGRQVHPVRLKRQYDQALFDRDVGDRSRVAYWADLLHPLPPPAPVAGSLATEAVDDGLLEPRVPIEDLVPEDDDARAFAQSVHERMMGTALAGDTPALASAWGAMSTQPFEAKILPTGWFRRRVTELLTRKFLRDVAAYLYDEETRERIRDTLRAQLVAEGGVYVLVTHSWGTVVAHDVLHELDGTIDVPLWVTLGSPLGMAEIQDHLAPPLKVPSCVQRWENFADRLDPVAADRSLADDFSPSSKITDHWILNGFTLSLREFNPHSALGYLGHADVRRGVARVVGPNFAAPGSRFVVARDLAGELTGSEQRLPVLIQLHESLEGKDLDAKRAALVEEISQLVGDPNLAQIDPLQRYVAAKLTAREVARLSARHENLAIGRVWKDRQKQALLDVSIHRLQAYTAQQGYRATGEDIAWAVLDTGIRHDHPHFATHANVAARWNCTRPGGAVPDDAEDLSGHGTHVAGIIAGEEPNDPPPQLARGKCVAMAPRARLHVYKVLDDQGRGRDSWVIKALDHVGRLNEQSARLVVHGVNLSLGGPFDAEVFGCGHSPLCQELRRLWRQGVLVCVAAGNEGRLLIDGPTGRRTVNLDLSIGDPANLDEAVAVGSVHRKYPHLYGVSYFSSRGPTADGRQKPDLVAPGERIVSCNALLDPNDATTHYIPQSGTSMACPHVSGLLAAFLSVRPDYLGRPDEAKRLLLSTATDLGRDPYHQGAGMPNLIQMLAGT